MSTRASVVVLACLALLFPRPAFAQEKVGSDFIPFDGIAVIVLNPAAILSSPSTQLYPHEIAEAWALDNVGLSAKDCQSIKFVAAMPGPAGPMAALVVKMNSDFSIKDLHPQIIGQGEMIDVNGRQCIQIAGGALLHQLDSKTAILATADWLDNVIKAAEGNPNGTLANLADETSHAGHFSVLVSIEPVRPIVNGFFRSQIDQIPPPFVEFTRIPDLLDAVVISVDLEDSDAGMKLILLATDEDAAKEMQTIVVDGLNLGKMIAMQQAMSDLNGDDPTEEAMREYVQRVGNLAVDRLTPQLSGRRLTLTASPGGGIATQGILAAFLLPAVQSARFAARRVKSMNGMKQIGLALHNYHSAYRMLPVKEDGRDDDGKPLLSWRVHILPFVEQQQLYEQFHLDEPWDSEHNIQLLEQMPDVFVHDNVPLPAGKTIFRAPVGDDYLFKPDAPVRFRDVLDGLSNTIMVYEANADHAIEWTKPDEADIDHDNPLEVMGNAGDTFNVLMGDGAVRAVPMTIDKETIQALLTRAGREAVDF